MDIPNTVNSEIFARILFSRISLKDIICVVKNSRLGYGLPTSVDRIARGCYFHETSHPQNISIKFFADNRRTDRRIETQTYCK